jgi:hypothetical protein
LRLTAVLGQAPKEAAENWRKNCEFFDVSTPLLETIPSESGWELSLYDNAQEKISGVLPFNLKRKLSFRLSVVLQGISVGTSMQR